MTEYFQPHIDDPKLLPCRHCGKMWDAHIVVKTFDHRDRGELRKCPREQPGGAAYPLPPKPPSFSQEDVLKILSNVGVDGCCGACMAVAFTGSTSQAHTCIRGAR